MLRSHAELRESTGSLEMFVFQTLSAGNSGQFGAPGTVVDDVGALAGIAGGETGGTDDAAPAAEAIADDADSIAGDVDAVVGVAAAQPPAVPASSAAVATARIEPTKCPVSKATQEWWHAASRRRADPA
ncbi:MAG TPA: hypothetical protein VLM11_08255 [Streptosporangiaceae bacterium]|nr:hypothetical protein [Streptosporangiaceae bacterium]